LTILIVDNWLDKIQFVGHRRMIVED
jgi:hypothetical protein